LVETSAQKYQTARCHNPKDHNLNIYYCEVLTIMYKLWTHLNRDVAHVDNETCQIKV